VNIFLVIASTAIEFLAIWWFITREYRRQASLRRSLSWLVLIACLFCSPFLQISVIRQIAVQRELANTIAHAWVIVVSLCGLIFMFTMLRKIGNDNSAI
jgi:hypothetical protein